MHLDFQEEIFNVLHVPAVKLAFTVDVRFVKLVPMIYQDQMEINWFMNCGLVFYCSFWFCKVLNKNLVFWQPKLIRCVEQKLKYIKF